MKVCDVVLNSIWYDPRVRKQIISYMENGIDVCAVGLMDKRYDEEKVQKIPCKVTLADIPNNYKGKQRSILRKLKREKLIEKAVCDAIIVQKPDLIHANDLNALIPAYKAAKKLKCKLIYDSHEINVENNKYINKKLWKKVLWLKEKKLVKKVDLMLCVSNAAAEYFSKTYKIKKPMVVTNCALKSETVDFSKVSKNLGFEVLNHGQFYAGRGYDVMLKACEYIQDLPKIKLAIRGFGQMENELRELSKKYDKRNQFIFYPPVTVQELIPEAAKSHVGVAITEAICLNFKLSVSNKLFEYASAGLPVIMSDIPEHRYLNEKYKFGIVIKDNTPECFAEAVKKLYLDKEFYNTCANNAKLMSQEINWENEFNKLIQAEKELFYR